MERKNDLFARVAFLDDEGLKITCERWFKGIGVTKMPKTGASGAWEAGREIHLKRVSLNDDSYSLMTTAKFCEECDS